MSFVRSFLNQLAALNSPKTQPEDFKLICEARYAALEKMFGSHGMVYSGKPSFQFGGESGVVEFENFLVGGKLFVTIDLTGYPGIVDQPGDFFNGYELAICQPDDEIDNPLNAKWLISNFARITLTEYFAPEHTSDIRAPNLPLDGLIFTTFGKEAESFTLDGRQYGILLAVGISVPEMEFAIREGGNVLLERMKEAGVYPWTRVNRPSVV